MNSKMPKIRVTPEELGTAANKLSELSQSYSEIYQQLLQQAGTMGDAWEGEDNIAFVDQINGFCEELKAMAQKLSDVSGAMVKQQTNYATRQQDNITQVRKLTN